MQVQPRLSLAEWDALTTWRPPCSIYSTWPAGKPLTDRDPWWRDMIGVNRPLVRTRRLTVDRRERFIDAAVAAARACENPFNAEGPLRVLVRSELCLMRWPWREADAEAAAVFEEALRRVGVRARPSWEEAQRVADGFDAYARTYCVRCGEPIPDERTGGNRGRGVVKYCSDRCSQAHNASRVRFSGERVTRAEFMSRCAARTQRALEAEIDCPGCGKPFRPGYNVTRQKFCSKACADVHKTRRQSALDPVTCVQCGESFQPRGVGVRKYCSPACYHEGARREVRGVERACEVCSTIFRLRSAAIATKTCSRRCGYAWRARGTHPPAKRKPAADEDDGQGTARRCA